MSSQVRFTVLLLLALESSNADSIGSGVFSDAGVPIYLSAVLAISVIVSAVVIIIGCAWCDRQQGFKDFHNEIGVPQDVPSANPAGGPLFTMVPPIEDTPNDTLVTFEPLPSLPQHMNSGQDEVKRKPKIFNVSRDKARSNSLLNSTGSLFPRNHLQFIKELGNGWFGKVLQGEALRVSGGVKKTRVVIRLLNEEASPEEQLQYLREVMPYRELEHPNVLKLLGQCLEATPYLLILELCPFGDMKTYLSSHKVAVDSFNQKGLLLKFACDAAAGLAALHQHDYVHRDFATRNCLLASDLSVKVGDYGISEDVHKDEYYWLTSEEAVPIRWAGPECLSYIDGELKQLPPTKEGNVWTYGVVLWEILEFARVPYDNLSDQEVLQQVIADRTVKLSIPEMDISHKDRLYELMKLCFLDKEQRPSIRELRIMILHLLTHKDKTNMADFEIKWSQLLPKPSPKAVKVGNGTSNGVTRPGGFDSDFIQDQSWTKHPLESMSPRNEISLAAELNFAASSPPPAESPDNDIDFAQELGRIPAAKSPPEPARNYSSLADEMGGAQFGGNASGVALDIEEEEEEEEIIERSRKKPPPVFLSPTVAAIEMDDDDNMSPITPPRTSTPSKKVSETPHPVFQTNSSQNHTVEASVHVDSIIGTDVSLDNRSEGDGEASPSPGGTPKASAEISSVTSPDSVMMQTANSGTSSAYNTAMESTSGPYNTAADDTLYTSTTPDTSTATTKEGSDSATVLDGSADITISTDANSSLAPVTTDSTTDSGRAESSGNASTEGGDAAKGDEAKVHLATLKETKETEENPVA